MNYRAFDSLEELEDYCEGIDKNEFQKVIQDGYEEYGYKTNENECTFSKDELSEMSQILEDRF